MIRLMDHYVEQPLLQLYSQLTPPSLRLTHTLTETESRLHRADMQYEREGQIDFIAPTP